MNRTNESVDDDSVDSNVVILQITSTTVNLVLGVPINSWVLWLVLTGAAGTMASDIFPLNLSVCAIILSLFYFVMLFVKIRPLYFLTYAFQFIARPVFQTCICVERFVAVVHPVLFLKYKPLRYRVAFSALAWLLIVGLSLLNILLALYYTDEMANYLHLIECLVLVSVMLFCSLAIYRVLRRPPVPAPEKEGWEREREDGMKKRAFIIICLIMVSFLATYFIWGIAAIVVNIRELSSSLDRFTSTWVLVTVLFGLVQPLVYLRQKAGKPPCVRVLSSGLTRRPKPHQAPRRDGPGLKPDLDLPQVGCPTKPSAVVTTTCSSNYGGKNH